MERIASGGFVQGTEKVQAAAGGDRLEGKALLVAFRRFGRGRQFDADFLEKGRELDPFGFTDAGVGDGEAPHLRQSRREFDLLGAEIPGLARVEPQHPDDLLLGDHRHRKDGVEALVAQGVAVLQAGVVEGVLDADRFPLQHLGNASVRAQIPFSR